MSETIGALRGIPAPASRWDDAAGSGLSVSTGSSTGRVCSAPTARLRTSGAGTRPPRRRPPTTRVARSGFSGSRSGTDLASISAGGFAGLRLDELLPLRDRAEMDDAAMVDYLRASAVRADQPRPSIETLLHAFIPATHVDHTHPDAVIALTSNPNGRTLAEQAFGDEIVWLDYQRPGFDMSRRIALLLEETPTARAVLLEKHGLVTWGETGEESYESTIEFVSRAARAIDDAAQGGFGLGGRKAAELEDGAVAALLSQSLPVLRGALLADADGLVLEVDRSTEAVAFASAARTGEVSQTGRPVPTT